MNPDLFFDDMPEVVALVDDKNLVILSFGLGCNQSFKRLNLSGKLENRFYEFWKNL